MLAIAADGGTLNPVERLPWAPRECSQHVQPLSNWILRTLPEVFFKLAENGKPPRCGCVRGWSTFQQMEHNFEMVVSPFSSGNGRHEIQPDHIETNADSHPLLLCKRVASASELSLHVLKFVGRKLR